MIGEHALVKGPDPDLAAALRPNGLVLTVPHKRPDGDTLGAAVGLALALRSEGTDVRCLIPDPLPAPYASLPGLEPILVRRLEDLGTREPSTVVLLDGASRERFPEVPCPPARLVNIDHHESNTAFGDVDRVHPTSSSTCELVYLLLARGLGHSTVPEAAASWLLAGVLSDTAGLRRGSVTPWTLQATADLAAAGASLTGLQRLLFGADGGAALAARGRHLQQVEYVEGGRIALLDVQSGALPGGASQESSEGLVEEMMLVRGVHVAIHLRPSGPGKTRVSLRSAGAVDVSKVAADLGGGGHPDQAGATLEGPSDAVRERVLKAAARVCRP